VRLKSRNAQIALLQQQVSIEQTRTSMEEKRVKLRDDEIEAFRKQIDKLAATTSGETQRQIETLRNELKVVHTRQLDPQTIPRLVELMTEGGDLFQAGRNATDAATIQSWNRQFDTWFHRTFEFIKTNVSESEAALFQELPGGILLGHYRAIGNIIKV
jgi:hypothetical protein